MELKKNPQLLWRFFFVFSFKQAGLYFSSSGISQSNRKPRNREAKSLRESRKFHCYKGEGT